MWITIKPQPHIKLHISNEAQTLRRVRKICLWKKNSSNSETKHKKEWMGTKKKKRSSYYKEYKKKKKHQRNASV